MDRPDTLMQARSEFHLGIVGLRAVAVLGVVVFHFLPSALPGGFVGVDIFFVISGFLISKSIYGDLDAGQFTFAKFYERRARRILPAFIAVSLATTIAAFFILLPFNYAEFARSLLASALFAANIYFYATSDYFAPAAGELPLLHYWSLGVEEQFYLIFPVLTGAIVRWLPKALPLVLATLFAASLISAEIMIGTSPQAAFYLLPFRGFELLLGSLLALRQVPFPKDSRLGCAASVFGLAIIFASMLLTTEASCYPGLTSATPCFGAALVILGAHSEDWRISRLLGSSVPLFFSNISYSLYLVHWPIAVLGARVFPDATPAIFAAGGLVSSTALGALSYWLVEQPFRVNRAYWTGRCLIASSGIALAATSIASIAIISAGGFPDRVTERVNALLATLQYNPRQAFQTELCFLEPEQDPSNYNEAACIPEGRPLVILWGDSHISQYLWGLRAPMASAGYQIAQLTASGCAPTLGVDYSHRPKCRQFNDFAINKIIEIRPSMVILGAVWMGGDEQLAGLSRSIATLTAAGIEIIVFGPSPFYKTSVPTLLANRLSKGVTDTTSGTDLEADFVYTNDSVMSSYVVRLAGARYISVLDTLCPAKTCPLEINGTPIHFDIAHLTREGSEYYAGLLFQKLFRDAQ